MNTFLRPCLVLGTGFHRWVLGESMQRDFKPLLDWNELLLEVAKVLHVPLDSTENSLSLHWERLLTEVRHEKGSDRKVDGRPVAPAVNVLEKDAKKKAASILAKYADVYSGASRRAKFPLKAVWGAVVSLNFDAHWHSAHKLVWKPLPKTAKDLRGVESKGDILSSELLRLNNHVELQGNDPTTRRLWFPNGYVGKSDSLRLGLREFGFQPVAIYHAFKAFKQFETSAGGFEKCIDSVRAILDGHTKKGSLLNVPLPLTWVTEMLYRPVCFAGVGMSDAEFGLWWLMVQRARNLAGVNPEQRPPAAILVKDDDPRIPFWHTKPCGIKPIICATWDEGWEEVEAWGESTQKAIVGSVRT